MNLFFRKVMVVLFAVLFFNNAEGQKLNVRLQTESGTPIPGGKISLFDNELAKVPTLTTTTDEHGIAIVELTNAPFWLQAEAMGYEIALKYITDNKTKSITISLFKKVAALDEVVVTGVSRPTKPRDALSLVRVIGNETIQAQGAVSLADALTTQLNINIGNDGILGNNIQMQGLTGDKVKILVDGMPVNGREAGNIDLGQLNLNNADHIEIIQGPMSVLYGSDALGGVINIVSKENFKNRELTATANYQTTGAYNFFMSGSHKVGKRHNFSLGAGRNFFQGWKYIDTSFHHRELLFNPKEQYLGNFNYSYNAPSGFKLRLSSDYLNEKVTNKGPATINPYEAYASDDYYKTQRSMNRFSVQGKLLKKGYLQSMNSYCYYHRVKNTFSTDLVTLNQSESLAELQDTTTSNDINSRTTYNNTIGKLDYTIGYDAAIETIKTTKIKSEVSSIQDYAGLVMLTMPIYKDKLKIQGGFRTSYNSLYKTPAIPSMNLLYKPLEKWQLRASYGKGYRAPNLKEMYLEFIDVNHHILGNANLRPETADHAELSSSYQFFQRQNEFMQLLLSGTYNDVHDEITLVNQEPQNPNSINYSYGNISHDQNVIFNAQLDGQSGRLQYNLGYSYRYVYGQEGQYESFDCSETSLGLKYTMRAIKTNVNLFYKYTGRQLRPQPDISGGASFNGTSPDYHMLKMSLERKFWNKKLQVVAGVDNIFNVQTLAASGVIASAHSGNGDLNFLPRSFFTTLRLMLE